MEPRTIVIPTMFSIIPAARAWTTAQSWTVSSLPMGMLMVLVTRPSVARQCIMTTVHPNLSTALSYGTGQRSLVVQSRTTGPAQFLKIVISIITMPNTVVLYEIIGSRHHRSLIADFMLTRLRILLVRAVQFIMRINHMPNSNAASSRAIVRYSMVERYMITMKTR